MTRFRLAALSAACCLTALTSAGAVIPDAAGHTPVLGAETAVGRIIRARTAPVTPTPKVIDGNVDDWTGESTRLGGSAIYSHGEYVYQDYLMDDWGADDGDDYDRLQTLDALREVEPRTYRVDSLQQAGGAQFDAPRPVGAELHYGDANQGALKDQADIEEARVAADAQNLYFMVRTTGMTSDATRLLILLDTEPGGSYQVPGGITTGAEWAIPVTPDRETFVSWYKGAASVEGARCCPRDARWDVAINPAGDANIVEFSLARELLEAWGTPLPSTLGVGIATALAGPDFDHPFAHVATGRGKADLINVAFRHEPARIWMDREQALALLDGNVDRFLARVSLDDLVAGATETFQQSPGYYERVYEAFDPNDPTRTQESKVNQEVETNSYYQGHFQHYGVYLPPSYSPGRVMPATFWMHYRGGHAHDAAAWEPGILRNFGDDAGAIVVTPSARGESSWYTGRGMEDFLSVWDDATSRYGIDADRVYLAGHSMGGWASNFLGLLFPDRWAAANPEDGLLVPGLWPGAGDPSGAQNGADIKAEFVYKIIQNARNIPYAILHGTEDELVPVTGAIAQGAKLHELGYRYRVYLFHAYEHYSAPIWDDWRDVVRYMTQFRRDPNPAHVTYSVWPALDHAVSTVSAPTGVDLGYRFDRAFWLSDVRTATPGAGYDNIGTVDAITYGRGFDETTGVPEAGTAAQPEPYTMHGQAWLKTGRQAAANRFTATLTNVGSVTFDVARMGLSTVEPMQAAVTTDSPVTLLLRGGFPPSATVQITGGSGSWSYDANGLTITLSQSATYSITITP